METNVKLSKSLILMAKKFSKASDRTVKEQLEHWINIGRLIEDNPDLTYEFIKNILQGQEEARDNKNLKPFKFCKNGCEL